MIRSSSIGVWGSEVTSVQAAERSMGEYTKTSQDNSKLVTTRNTKKSQQLLPTRERERKGEEATN